MSLPFARTIALLLSLAVLVAARATDAGEPPDAAENRNAAAATRNMMVERIDALLEQAWQREGVTPAPPAEDSEFLRRAYLDLTGVIPRISEVRAFLADSRPDKRAHLIDRLVDSPRYATHMATTWRKRMLPQNAENAPVGQVLGVQNWLQRRFAQNTRFDNVVADLLVATDGDELGPALYYRALDLAPEKLAASTAELFLGVRLHCAQCHDHPYSRWTQDDFWGLAAFFARVRGPGEAMQASGSYRLNDVPRGEVRLPSTDEIVPPTYPDGRLADEAEGGTRRLQLAIWMASRDNPYLARATANWAWAHLFGRGLIEPVGDAGDHNPPSHPELLDELANYLIRIEFDLQELWRTLARTRAYQLSGRPLDPQERPPAHLFACMKAKPLTAEQLYDSLMLSAPPQPSQTSTMDARQRMVATSLVLDPRRADFVRRMSAPSGDEREYSAGVLQALLLINGDTMAGATSPEAGALLGALDAPFLTVEERVEALFLATLSRLPDAEERTACLQYVTSESTDEGETERLGDILWSLLNSTEFAFNH